MESKTSDTLLLQYDFLADERRAPYLDIDRLVIVDESSSSSHYGQLHVVAAIASAWSISSIAASSLTAVLTPCVVTTPVTQTVTLVAPASSGFTTTGYVFTDDINNVCTPRALASHLP